MSGTPSTRLATAAVAVPAVIAAIVSYEHMREVASVAGEDWRAWLLPLSVDGLVVASSISAVTARRAGARVRRMTLVNLLTGLAVSVGANVLVPFLGYLSIVGGQILSAAVAAWPAVALALAFEELLRLRGSGTPAGAEPEAEAAPEPTPEPLPEPEPLSEAEAVVAEAETITAEAAPEPELVAVPITGSVRDDAIRAAVADPSLTGEAIGRMFPHASGSPRSDSWGRQIKRAAASL